MISIIASIRRNWRLRALVALGLLFVGVYAKGRHDGAAHEQRAEAKRLAAAQAHVAKREGRADQIAAKVGSDLTASRVRIEYRTRTLIQKVPAYVSQASDDRCIVPLGVVLLHNAAASGGEAELPAAPSGPLDAPSGLPLSAYSATVVENYGTAYDWRAEVMAWRAWYADQKAAWDRR